MQRKTSPRRRTLLGMITTLCVMMFCILYGTDTVYGASGLNVDYHTQNDIREYLKQNGATTNDGLTFSATPQTTAPFAAGKLSQETLQSSIKMLNQIRYIAGIPYNVQLSDSLSEKAQAASLVNYANSQLSHYPSQPAGMDSALYQLGCDGAQSSNIAWASWSGCSLNWTLVNSWMEDGDSGNIPMLGHRRWLLNPAMGQTGFGAVSGSKGTYSAVYAFDTSNSGNGANYNKVAWPAQNMPVSYFSKEFPWSVSLGTPVNMSGVKVSLVRREDGKTWNFSSSSSDGYFNVNNDGYGQTGCIIFRPDSSTLDNYYDGDVFDVTITGTPSGDIFYSVSFFDLIPLEDLYLSSETLSLKECETGTTLEVLPAGASAGSITWESSDESIVNFYSNGTKIILTSGKAGKADIYLKDRRGNVLDTCEVTVNHNPGAKATCTTSQTCNCCGAQITKATGHSYNSGVITKTATCKNNGVKTYTCKNCGDSYTKQIAKLSHTYTTKTTQKATTSKAGNIQKKCTTCNTVKNSSIAAITTVKLKTTSYTYNGKSRKPGVTVQDSNGKSLKKDTDYSISYAKDRKNVGKYKVTITFKGNYSGKTTKTFKIIPKKTDITGFSVKSKSKVQISWKKQTSQTTGYEIQYSTNKKFSGSATKKTTVKKSSGSYNISKLTPNKTYYVRIRTYKNVKVDGKTEKIYSGWSSVAKMKYTYSKSSKKVTWSK